MPYVKFDAPGDNNMLSSGPSGFISYMEKEDKEKGINKEFWFNQNDDYIPSYKIAEDIENQKGLSMNQFTYYTGSISFSEEELAFLKNDYKKLKEYGKAFINIYAENFNKNLSASDIRFYLKLESDRYYKGTDKEVRNGEVKSGTKKPGSFNTHFHFITGRKSVDESKKLSPNSNHIDTKTGAVTGGFSRDILKEKAETLFDRMFLYNRPLEQTYKHLKEVKSHKDIKKRIYAVDQSTQKSHSILKYDYLSIDEKHKKLGVLINYIQHGISRNGDGQKYNINAEQVLQLAKDRNYNGDIYKSLLNMNYRLKNEFKPEFNDLTPYIIQYAKFINAPYKQLPDSLKEDRFLRFARIINQKLPTDDKLIISELFEKEKQNNLDGSVYKALGLLNNNIRKGQTISNANNVVLEIAEKHNSKNTDVNHQVLNTESNSNNSLVSSLINNLSAGSLNINSGSEYKEEKKKYKKKRKPKIRFN